MLLQLIVGRDKADIYIARWTVERARVMICWVLDRIETGNGDRWSDETRDNSEESSEDWT